ncbi:hypothetical protein [Teichococcus deserti]|uniref:hypothetical protein n=1 Tax=Teichococcus deserti TaxID=1817963 RepID=UPI001055CF31|nr:hypothetical protein [Pseudoroseomonas deserti]
MFSEPDLQHAVVMQDVAAALVEALQGLVGQGNVPPGAAPRLLDNAIEGLPQGARSMVRFEAHRLWMRRIDNLG